MKAAKVDPILSTKLYIPRARPDRVPRPRLIGRMIEAMDYPFTLICAPAGYGKTTLLSEWIPQNDHCVTWLSLDEGDNDPTRFWRHFLAALQLLDPQLGKNAQLSLESSQVPEIEMVLSLAINELATLRYRFTHVFDDYHLVGNEAIDVHLTFLIEHLPPNMNLVIASRSDPALPLARWRARRQMTEVRIADLRFTREEAIAFFNQVMELHLSEEDVAALETRTEGWISGLQLAALSIRDHSDRARFISAFAGSHRFVIDYLAEEVLNLQSRPVREFLLSTSVLDRLCGPLCNALTGDSDGQAILEGLEQDNLFVVPLDDHRGWYRYHHLFREVLRSRLQATDDSKLSDLHLRAAGWFEANGLIQEAIHHSLTAKDWERAVRLILGVIDTTAFTHGQFKTVLAWLQTLPENVIHSQPRLSLTRAWILLTAGTVDSAEQNLREAERALSGQEPSLQLSIQGEITALRAMIASYRREISRTIELCSQARQQLPESDSFLRAAVANALGLAYRFSGRVVEASQAFSEAIALAQAAGNFYVMMDSVTNLARMQMLRGQLRAAEQTCRQALRFTDEQENTSGRPHFDSGFALIRLGEILRERNELDEAERLMLEGIKLGHLGGNLDIVVSGNGFLVGVKQAQGDQAGARAIKQKREKMVVAHYDRIVLSEGAARAARLSLAQGDLAAAEEWEKQRESLTDKDPAYLDEYAMVTLARLRIAQLRFADALDLLEQLQEDAEAAERMGRVLEILALEARALAAQGDEVRAHTSLERALALAEPEGYIRVFVDEGEPMRLLLLDYRSVIEKKIRDGIDSESLRLLTYINRLLAGFSQPAPVEKPKHETMVEPLSERELEVLRLIATGRTNQEIADILVIALSTVKSHINNLYGKLGTNNRIQAIAIARDVGLLSK